MCTIQETHTLTLCPYRRYAVVPYAVVPSDAYVEAQGTVTRTHTVQLQHRRESTRIGTH